MAGARKLADVKTEVLERSSETRRLWEETASRRALGQMLAELRTRTQLSQADVAKEAGWDKGYVSRLEGATEGFPDLKTLARYAQSCGENIGLLTYASTDEEIRITGFFAMVARESGDEAVGHLRVKAASAADFIKAASAADFIEAAGREDFPTATSHVVDE